MKRVLAFLMVAVGALAGSACSDDAIGPVVLPGVGSQALHQHLDTLGIPHEHEVLPGVTHAFSSLWHHIRPDGMVTGLYELRFHAREWGLLPQAGQQ